MSRTVKIECGINFRLRETGATKPTPITCFVEYKGKPVVKIPTGTKVHPTKWNPEKERSIGGLKVLESAEAKAIIEKLATVKATVETEYRTFVNKFQSYPDRLVPLNVSSIINFFVTIGNSSKATKCKYSIWHF